MNFYQAIEAAKNKAKELWKLCYVYEGDNSNFHVSSDYKKGWLYRIYPGGRQELSIKGNELLRL